MTNSLGQFFSTLYAGMPVILVKVCSPATSRDIRVGAEVGCPRSLSFRRHTILCCHTSSSLTLPIESVIVATGQTDFMREEFSVWKT